QRMVSIHRPLGYGPSKLPLRHSALSHPKWDSNPQPLGSLHFQLAGLPSRGWFRSIDLWVMGPARFRCATLLFLTPDGTRTHNPWVHCIFSCRGLPSRGLFRSIDLWVIVPALFRCATLLFLPAVLLLAPGLSMQKYILEKYESQAFCCLVSI